MGYSEWQAGVWYGLNHNQELLLPLLLLSLPPRLLLSLLLRLLLTLLRLLLLPR